VEVKYYKKSSGRSPVEEFLEECSSTLVKEYADAFFALEAGEPLTMPLSRNLSSIYLGLHELRLHDHFGQVRVFYYIRKQDAIYMIHACHKKTQKLPHREIDLIIKRIKEL